MAEELALPMQWLPEHAPRVLVIGAGVSGLVTATVLAGRGAKISLIHRPETRTRASHFAGGMLAPWCEAADAPPRLAQDAAGAIDWWSGHFAGTQRHGSLVVAPRRDREELARFARRTSHHTALDAAAIAALEPDLAGRFDHGLHFAEEAHLDPRKAMEALAEGLRQQGVSLRDCDADEARFGDYDRVVDCRGHAAAQDWRDLRGVRGEMLLLRCPDISLSRPVRLLHPRIPLYIVPRGDHCFMVGATMIESSDRRTITARSTMDLLNAAYTLHPAFAEAEILEAGANIRPALPDNMPALKDEGQVLRLNGMYRHGFLLAPHLANQAADSVLDRHTHQRKVNA